MREQETIHLKKKMAEFCPHMMNTINSLFQKAHWISSTRGIKKIINYNQIDQNQRQTKILKADRGKKTYWVEREVRMRADFI